MTTTEAKAKFKRILTLSDREYRVFKLLGEGLSPIEIGKKLSISATTVRCYLYRMQWKLGLENYRQTVCLSALYLDSGLKREPKLPEAVARYKFVDPESNVVSLKVA